MKKTKALLLRVLIVFLIPFTASGQQSNSVAPVLSVYYEIKNALVSGDATSAASAASRFVALVQSVDAKKLSSNESQVFNTVQSKLISEAGSIAASRDLRKQRTSFQSVSDAIILLVRVSKVQQPAYIAYCPMKKAYWISEEKVIKNPYYGTSMLTCGKVTETIH
jgi:hypothetical protein